MVEGRISWLDHGDNLAAKTPHTQIVLGRVSYGFVTNRSSVGFCHRRFAQCSCLDDGCVLCATSELGKMVTATLGRLGEAVTK